MSRLALVLPALLSAACASPHITAHRGIHLQGSVGPTGIFGEGVGGTVSVAAGYAVGPNLILGAQGWESSVTALLADSRVYGIGPMLEYYLEPSNAYVSATPCLTRLSSRLLDRYGSETGWAPGLRAAAGKEWFVSQRWGLGIGGVVDVISDRLRSDHTAVGVAVVFSASFN